MCSLKLILYDLDALAFITSKTLWYLYRLEETKYILEFKWGRQGEGEGGKGGHRNRKCFTALHPSLNPDVNSSEGTSSRQHEVQWAQPPGSSRSRCYGKLSVQPCRAFLQPFTVSTTLPAPLSSHLRDTCFKVDRCTLFCPCVKPASFTTSCLQTGGITVLIVDWA